MIHQWFVAHAPWVMLIGTCALMLGLAWVLSFLAFARGEGQR